jgi:hypothetical protein
MDIGRAALMADDGIPKLVAALLLNAFPQQKSEAKELYRAGHAEQGLLARQRGESIHSFVSRRRRWWIKLTTMDNTIRLSTETLGELMLDCARLGKVERLMALTSTGNSTEFEKVATALMDQHAQLHRDETRTDRDNGSYQPKRRFFKKPFKRQAYAADQEAYGEEETTMDSFQGPYVTTDSFQELYVEEESQHGYAAGQDDYDESYEDPYEGGGRARDSRRRRITSVFCLYRDRYD